MAISHTCCATATWVLCFISHTCSCQCVRLGPTPEICSCQKHCHFLNTLSYCSHPQCWT
jgi:hypothetical protein